MLDVLLESRSHEPRRLGGTIASALTHTALISAAVAVAHPTRGGAVAAPPKDTVIWVAPRGPEPPARRENRAGGRLTSPRMPTVPRVDVPMFDGPVIDIRGPVVDDGLPCRDCNDGPPASSLIRSGVISGAPIGTGVIDEHEVDRAPRLLGRPLEPRYPAVLRESGVRGSVVVQFVVDTLGRVELHDVQIMQSQHPLFTESVREALARYRFAPGEVAGRRVPTRVQIPFEFRLR
jgi:protein TonB